MRRLCRRPRILFSNIIKFTLPIIFTLPFALSKRSVESWPNVWASSPHRIPMEATSVKAQEHQGRLLKMKIPLRVPLLLLQIVVNSTFRDSRKEYSPKSTSRSGPRWTNPLKINKNNSSEGSEKQRRIATFPDTKIHLLLDQVTTRAIRAESNIFTNQ